jgi:hypothetical protein
MMTEYPVPPARFVRWWLIYLAESVLTVIGVGVVAIVLADLVGMDPILQRVCEIAASWAQGGMS